jgi:hypothetical protein
MLGASEGGLIATLSVEQTPELCSGGLALCGPIGEFQDQVNYIGDFRVLFDYFFPGVLPGSPTIIPAELIRNWDSLFVPRVKAALREKPAAAAQLIATSSAPVDPAVPSTLEDTAISLLWYSTFGTNDATAKLGGNPYDNRTRWYTGSPDDLDLNLRVARFDADPVARMNLNRRYQTSGNLTRPLVTLHTTDEAVSESHRAIWRTPACSRDCASPGTRKTTMGP